MRKKIKHLMVERNLSQTDLAKLLGYTPQHISKIISGEVGGTQKFWDNFKTVLNIPDSEIEEYRKDE